MQHARGEALNEFLGHVGELDDPASLRLAQHALNRAMTVLWLKRDWRVFQSPAPFEMACVVGQRSYALPDYFGRISKAGQIRNLSRGGCRLDPLPAGVLEREFPWAGTSREVAGPPRFYDLAGVVGVQAQPLPTGEALELVSDNTGDTTVMVSLAGTDGTGTWRRAAYQLTGTTPVTAGTWTYLDEMGKGYPPATAPTTGLTSAGNVTLRVVSGARVLQSLTPLESAREHQVITLVPKPAAPDVLALPLIRRVKKLAYDSDPLPADWWPALMEELTATWRDNTGEAGTAAAFPRPMLADLISLENVSGPRQTIRPFGGY